MNPDVSEGPASLGALQRGAGILRERHARSRRRHAALVRRQLGQHSPPANARGTQALRRRRHLLPLRLRRRTRAPTSGSTPFPSPKIWEQMNLAYAIRRRSHLDRQCRRPEADGVSHRVFPDASPGTRTAGRREAIADYTRLWAEREFGPEHAAEIAHIVSQYTKLNGRRKPELIDPDTFSQINYQEADRVLARMAITGRRSGEQFTPAFRTNERDAFSNSSCIPTKASALVTKIYITAGKNHLYALQGRASANDLAAQVRALFQADADLSAEYNHKLANGKWDHMMDQTHLGYTSWQQPTLTSCPKFDAISFTMLGHGRRGRRISSCPGMSGLHDESSLSFDVFNQQRRYIDVFNHGKAPFEFSVNTTRHGFWLSLNVARSRKISASG